MNDLHLELLEEFDVSLSPNGTILGGNDRVHYDGDYILGYRDEGPDAWASSYRFSGPAWCISNSHGWEFYENGVQYTGYEGLWAIVVNIEEDGLHVTNILAEEY